MDVLQLFFFLAWFDLEVDEVYNYALLIDKNC